jgi:beta-xylosidase
MRLLACLLALAALPASPGCGGSDEEERTFRNPVHRENFPDPHVIRVGGTYYLFFSANMFDSDFYAVGYATCRAPLGPCADAPENPILRSACAASGPGHQTVVQDDDGETWFAYHAWPKSGEEKRVVWIDPLTWEDGKPTVEGPTCEPQAVP